MPKIKETAESDATGVCNVARGERVSLNKLAELVIKLVGNSIHLEESLKETIGVMRDG
jgi:nucleoside-diphosphate-sugar epimerase